MCIMYCIGGGKNHWDVRHHEGIYTKLSNYVHSVRKHVQFVE